MLGSITPSYFHSLGWEDSDIPFKRKQKYFMDNNLQITVISRINTVSHEKWGEKQVTDTNKKSANATSDDRALLSAQPPAAFLLVYVCTLLDAVSIVEEEEEFVNTDFDLSEVFPRIWSIRRQKSNEFLFFFFLRLMFSHVSLFLFSFFFFNTITMLRQEQLSKTPSSLCYSVTYRNAQFTDLNSSQLVWDLY